ncbi:hypothetical protein ET464_16830 [Paenibacillus protaetiae]|uniref:Uncharacterized protein n=1 Tax=Paenibacillus protaetiae TaxID=2509456 RepID=A0A4P6EYJ9_9BACL|nr:hypothetical protein ET464_16830 [Paenibacillus protaetiae]
MRSKALLCCTAPDSCSGRRCTKPQTCTGC